MKPNKTRPTAALSTTNPTRRYLGSNAGGRGDKQAANHLTRPAALKALIRYYCKEGSGRILFIRKFTKEVRNIEIMYS